MGQIKKLPYQIIYLLIIGYRYLVSPILPSSCRYYPSCSSFALMAIENYGLLKGSWMAILRILRCHPWAAGGYDPVLTSKEKH